MNLLQEFYGTKKEVAVIDNPKSYPKEVMEIHHAFKTAGDNILAEAQSILKECEGKSVEKGNRLIKLGFKQSKEAVIAKDIIGKENNAREIADLVVYYKVNYPNNKFITENQVKAICEKWGLVCGDTDKFLGFVPEKNLAEIEAFKLKKSECNLIEAHNTYVVHCSLGYFRKDEILSSSITYLIASGRFEMGKITSKLYDLLVKSALNNGVPENAIFVQWSEINELHKKICAPLKDMDTTGMKLHGYKLEKHYPDPVVLQPVHGGYLIVTAWGDEATDENVVNQINN